MCLLNKSNLIISKNINQNFIIIINTFIFIKAPDNLKIYLKIVDLDIEDNDKHDYCNDYLEVRYFNLGQPGPKFCGNLKKYDGVLSFTSFQNNMLLIFSSDWAVNSKGFKIQANLCF